MDTKSFLLSKTVWGTIITSSVAVSKILGFELIITDQPELVDGIITTIGLIITIYGIVTRSTKLVLFK